MAICTQGQYCGTHTPATVSCTFFYTYGLYCNLCGSRANNSPRVVSQFPVDCTVETCQLFVKGAVWEALIPNYPRVNALDKMTYLKRYIHFMKLFCGAVHLHPLLLSNTNSKHSAISRTACKAMEAEHGLHKGDSGLGNHQFWVP